MHILYKQTHRTTTVTSRMHQRLSAINVWVFLRYAEDIRSLLQMVPELKRTRKRTCTKVTLSSKFKVTMKQLEGPMHVQEG